MARAEAGERLALVTVIAVRGSAPRHGGTKMLVSAEGAIAGTIGGGRIEQEATQLGVEVAAGAPARRLRQHLVRDLAMCCGGSMELYVEPVTPSLPALRQAVARDITVGMVEYFERRAFGRHVDSSRLFLYKATRNLMQVTGDTGAFLRNTMGALVLFGVPPEDYWPYKTEDFEQEPPAFCYAFAQNFQAISYFCLDPAGTDKQVLLHRIKDFLARGLPSIFGFTVYSSISQSEKTGRIPYPSPGDRIVGGHAVMAVGYDDSLEIVNTAGGIGTTGAMLLRNSWGEGWGEAGYGWLPYDYVVKGLAEDWWCLLKNEWVDTGKFKT